ncbi:putative Histone-lysine N-methyltransferase ATXR5 [Bienertia sinuspersici]
MAPFSSTQKLFPFKGSVHRTAAYSPENTPEKLKLRVKKYKTMDEILAKAKYAVVEKEDYSDVNCEECGSGEGEGELLLCDKCDKGFHMGCVRPIVVRVPIGSWVCPICSGLSQKKIIDFFRIQKCKNVAFKYSSSSQDSKKRRKRGTLVCYKKKRRRLLPYVPTEDPARRLDQMRSLATALTALNMEFCNELFYLPGMAPKSANQARFENGGMQVLSKEDYETVEQCRAMLKIGECPPLLVVYDLCEGYTVQADAPIKDMTFIAEYSGDVDFIKNRERDDCDSLMTLLLATDPSNSLVICPDKRGNVARFISGINNHTPESKKKQNLKCVRYDVNGACCVFLVATRDIARGERLYYDYNGYEHEYPTHHFI